MTLTLTNEGIQIQTFAELFADVVGGYQGIYGADTDFAQESPDGQRVGIETRRWADMQSLVLQIYNSQDPELADGMSFNRILKLSGLFLRPASRSQVDVTVTMTVAKTLSAGYTVRDDLDQLWITTEPNAVVVGPNTVTLFAENFGEVAAQPDTVVTPVTIELGVDSVTNPLAATLGTAEELVPDARERRRKSLENPAQSNRAKMFTAVGNIANVTDVAVYENSENVTVDTIPPNHIWVVVEGGSAELIGETIAKNRHDGVGTKGNETQIYTETLTRPSGSTLDIQHIMNYDRPTVVPLTVTVTATKKLPADVVNTAEIAAKIAAVKYEINEAALATELYSPAYTAGDNFILTDMQINDGSGATTGQILNSLDERFTIDAIDVTVTVP